MTRGCYSTSTIICSAAAVNALSNHPFALGLASALFKSGGKVVHLRAQRANTSSEELTALERRASTSGLGLQLQVTLWSALHLWTEEQVLAF
jgi:hypothetical protein